MNGLATITIAGQKVGLKFGLPALQRVTEKMKEYDLRSELGTAHILFAGYLNYCMMREEAPTLQLQPFYEYAEEVEDTPEGVAELSAAVRSFQESRCVRKVLENAKKKAMMTAESTGMKSSPSSMENSDTPLPITAGSPGENIS